MNESGSNTNLQLRRQQPELPPSLSGFYGANVVFLDQLWVQSDIVAFKVIPEVAHSHTQWSTNSVGRESLIEQSTEVRHIVVAAQGVQEFDRQRLPFGTELVSRPREGDAIFGDLVYNRQHWPMDFRGTTWGSLRAKQFHY